MQTRIWFLNWLQYKWLHLYTGEVYACGMRQSVLSYSRAKKRYWHGSDINGTRTKNNCLARKRLFVQWATSPHPRRVFLLNWIWVRARVRKCPLHNEMYLCRASFFDTRVIYIGIVPKLFQSHSKCEYRVWLFIAQTGASGLFTRSFWRNTASVLRR